MKRILLTLGALALILGTLGCQLTDEPTAAATEKPLAAAPRFADLVNAAPVQEPEPLPSFVITDYQEIRTAEAWEISGTIQQRPPGVPGLNFDRLVVVFRYIDGRDCEWRTAEHGKLEGLQEPANFRLVIQADGYIDSGFGFADFADFQDNAQVGSIVVQADRARYYVKSGGEYVARFVVPVEGGNK